MDAEYFEFLSKKQKYSVDLIKCIDDSHAKLQIIGRKPLMMLGKIQSGKTRAFIGLIAKSFDSGFDMAIVLTKNSRALAEQTVKRLQSDYDEMIKNDMVEVFNIISMPDKLSRFEIKKKLILIVKKEKNNIEALFSFIDDYSLKQSRRVLIIDDEADFYSVGFKKNKNDGEYDLRYIADRIDHLRGHLDCQFVQVTATPYALFLQPDEIKIRNNSKEPIKPSETVLVPSGEGYVGGNEYFNGILSDYLFNFIDDDEIQILKESDRRKFKLEDSLTSNKISGLRSSLINFIVAGCIRIFQNGGKPQGQRYSFIIHTETKKSSHKRQFEMVDTIIKQIENSVQDDEALIRRMVASSLNEFTQSVSAGGFILPDFETTYELFKSAVQEGWIISVVINSDSDIKDDMLDEDGQLKLRAPMTLFIGGQILDRGLTVSNLIGFYYGRNPQRMQQDTVLQHARMYGYRNKSDLTVTRFYTTRNIYERMRKINDFDNELRIAIENGQMNDGIYFILQDKEGKVIPCSPTKILMSDIEMLRPGRRILPVGFTPLPKSRSRQFVDAIDRILKSYKPQIEGEYEINKQDALKIIEHCYSSIEIEKVNSISREGMISILNYLSNNNRTIPIICRVNRHIKKFRQTKQLYFDNPDDGATDLAPARKIAVDNPSLILLRQRGAAEDGWKNDTEFWWPILVVQQNAKMAAFTDKLTEIEESEEENDSQTG